MFNYKRLTISQEISLGLLFALLAGILESPLEEVSFDFEKGFKVHGSHSIRLALGPLIFMASLRPTHDLFNLGSYDIEEILRRRAIDLVCLHGILLTHCASSARHNGWPLGIK